MMRPLDRLVAIGVLALLPSTAAADPNLCTQTSRAALRACENDLREELWIAVGNCANLPTDADRKDCRRQAKQSLREEGGECRDQFEAREDLCDQVGQGPYVPAVDPARFVHPDVAATAPNPWFPLVPGTIWIYAEGDETVTVTVTDETRVISGVTCRVVHDVALENGVPTEDTDDYFAQDIDGSVWYFGELSRNFEGGLLTDLDGSWIAGENGAKPGVIMPAVPVAGVTYRQEFALGEAEDAATVLATTASESVPATSCAGTCVLTLDFTPIEPDAREQKFYAPGIGPILTVNLETGARGELLSVVVP